MRRSGSWIDEEEASNPVVAEPHGQPDDRRPFPTFQGRRDIDLWTEHAPAVLIEREPLELPGRPLPQAPGLPHCDVGRQRKQIMIKTKRRP